MNPVSEAIKRMHERQHKAWAEAHDLPREGYSCGPHAETWGGGCFNCGWPGPQIIVEQRAEAK